MIWTNAKSDTLAQTIGKTLQTFRPNVPAHRFETIKEELPELAPGEVLLACGEKAYKILQSHKFAPKNKSLNSMRQKRLTSPTTQGEVFVTHDPYTLKSFPEKSSEQEWDVRLTARYKTTGKLEPEVGDYQWVPSFAKLIERVTARYKATKKPVDVSFDLETMGLNPFFEDKDIISIFFTDRVGHAEGLYLGDQPVAVKPDQSQPLWEQIEWLLTSEMVKLRGSNLKYDMVWVKEKLGIQCTNLAFDNCLVGSLLDENRSNSLNMHAKSFSNMGGYDDTFNDTFNKGHMENVPTDKLLTYAGGDVDAAQQVADVFRDQLVSDEQQTRFYLTILHPATRAFEKVEHRGLLVDEDKYHLLKADLEAEISSLEMQLLDILPSRIKFKFLDKIEEQMAQGKSPFLPSVLQAFFFSPQGLNLKPKMVTEAKQMPSMTIAHLKMFSDNPKAKEFVGLLEKLNSATKTYSTFVVGFLKHLCPDKRFHASYMLFHGDMFEDAKEDSGTVTGRLSCKGPAIQTIPKKTTWAKRIRECFIAPPGKAILMLDYSQGELRVVACVANEKTMISAYQQGLDLHAVTGAQLSSTTLEEFLTWKDNDNPVLAYKFDDYRGRAKPANFGLLYGMLAEGFLNYAWAAYGLKLSLKEAEDIRNAFFALYGGLLDYHDLMRKIVKMTGVVKSPLGRIRHLPHINAFDNNIRNRAQRQAINSPIQSCLSDMMCWAIARIDQEFPNGEIAVVGMIHDALIAYVDADKIELYAKQAREIMSTLPLHELGWSPVLSFPADAEYGTENMANMTKMKFAA